jgi:tRNA dimethylallyltransferase
MKKSTKKPKIIVILGPTATGKSDLAVKIARTCNGEVISADSRQVYRGMDLGSGKITRAEMRGVPHHLIDVASPRSVYNVAKFQRDAYKAIDSIIARGKTPIVCGGTGFYIQSIVDGVIVPEVPPNHALRKKLARMTTDKLCEKLKQLDPERLADIDTQNPVRLIRAIEIATALGAVPQIVKQPRYNCLQIGLTIPFEELEKKIAKRLTKRMKLGMLDEAQKLRKAGMSWKRMESFGLEYRFMAQFLQKKISEADMLDQIRVKSLQFAKRQMRWFSRDKQIQWFAPTNLKEICDAWHHFLTTS